MKFSTPIRFLTTALGATQALGKNEGFEVRLRDIESAGDAPLTQNSTASAPTPSAPANATSAIEPFDLSNSLNLTDLPTEADWIIPVSHAACTEWTLGGPEIRAAIEDVVVWNNQGHTVPSKYVHWELEGWVGTYICNCKLRYRDHAPGSEMWEFYARLVKWCGVGHSGWIFSKKWEKGWAVTARDYVVTKNPKKGLCPPYCAITID
ncbi:hypothetical protein F4804DRAFT_334932 [Jackrogersella minutella]|nr:hypothetical protein F4804DRAFT_334932 [Jackrogersella minutella]